MNPVAICNYLNLHYQVLTWLVLILNQLVKEDGTIEKINIGNLTKEGIKKTFDEKLSEFFEQYFEKWLNQNISKYLDKYFSKKEK